MREEKKEREGGRTYMKLMTPVVSTASAALSPGMIAARHAPFGPLRSHFAPFSFSLRPAPAVEWGWNFLSHFLTFSSIVFHLSSSSALSTSPLFEFISGAMVSVQNCGLSLSAKLFLLLLLLLLLLWLKKDKKKKNRNFFIFLFMRLFSRLFLLWRYFCKESCSCFEISIEEAWLSLSCVNAWMIEQGLSVVIYLIDVIQVQVLVCVCLCVLALIDAGLFLFPLHSCAFLPQQREYEDQRDRDEHVSACGTRVCERAIENWVLVIRNACLKEEERGRKRKVRFVSFRFVPDTC